MNFTSDHPALIDEIDRVSALTGTSEEIVQEQRHLLTEIRSYLVQLQSSIGVSPQTQNLPSTLPETEIAQRIAQTVMTELGVQRREWLYPLQADIQYLQQERDRLAQELRQLESYRQEMMMSFLQGVMNKFQTTLEEKLEQIINDQVYALSHQGSLSKTAPQDLPQLSDIFAQYLDQLQSFQRESDQVLVSLDLTLKQVFQSLIRDLNTYENDFSEGLTRIHQLGQQSELAFRDYLSPFTETNLDPVSSSLEPEPLPISEDINSENFRSSPEPISEFPVSAEVESPLDPLFNLDLNVSSPSPSASELENPLFNSDQFSYQSPPETETPLSPLPESLSAVTAEPNQVLATTLFGESQLQENGDTSLLQGEPKRYGSLAEILFELSSSIPEETSLEEDSSLIPPTSVSTTVSTQHLEANTITLLTDLLETGALDQLESREEEMEEEENLGADDLLPNHDPLTTALPTVEEVLTSETLEQIDQDLKDFESSDPWTED